MKQIDGKNRTAWIDYIKAFAIILIIMDHSMDTAGKTTLHADDNVLGYKKNMGLVKCFSFY